MIDFFAANDCVILAAYIQLFGDTPVLALMYPISNKWYFGIYWFIAAEILLECGYNDSPNSSISVTIKYRAKFFFKWWKSGVQTLGNIVNSILPKNGYMHVLFQSGGVMFY